MTEYTIYCTSEQIQKALELGAPLFRYTSIPNFVEVIEISTSEYYEIPTAEQMIGWLENKTIFKSIQINTDSKPTNWMYAIYFGQDDCLVQDLFKSRKEATLAAIDAALNYLVDNDLIK